MARFSRKTIAVKAIARLDSQKITKNPGGDRQKLLELL
jgi:hypothetical protein